MHAHGRLKKSSSNIYKYSIWRNICFALLDHVSTPDVVKTWNVLDQSTLHARSYSNHWNLQHNHSPGLTWGVPPLSSWWSLRIPSSETILTAQSRTGAFRWTLHSLSGSTIPGHNWHSCLEKNRNWKIYSRESHVSLFQLNISNTKTPYLLSI